MGALKLAEAGISNSFVARLRDETHRNQVADWNQVRLRKATYVGNHSSPDFGANGFGWDTGQVLRELFGGQRCGSTEGLGCDFLHTMFLSSQASPVAGAVGLAS